MEDGRCLTMFDLAIIGAGPAGCAAAITAARSGARVVLLESGRFPRHKVCGEFVSAESLGLLKTLLADDSPRLVSEALPVSHARIFLEGTIVQAKISPSAASITRYDLDAELWRACLETGVSTCQETTVHGALGSGPFEIQTSRGSFTARSLINASGRWSRFTSASTRARVNGGRWLGIKAHFHEETSSPSVDLYFFDGGYCGIQPVNTNGGCRINVCAMVRADLARSIDDVLGKHSELAKRSRTWDSAIPPLVTSPLVFHPPEPVQDSMLQVGDAATFVDPFIGDGISLALRSGAMAADCLAGFFKHQISLDKALNNYSREYQQRLAHVFRASSRLRGFLQWPSIIRKPVVSALARAPFLADQIVRMTR